MNVTATEANIQFLKPSTVYIFRVYAVNSHGFSKQPAQLSVTTQAEGWWLFVVHQTSLAFSQVSTGKHLLACQ